MSKASCGLRGGRRGLLPNYDSLPDAFSLSFSGFELRRLSPFRLYLPAHTCDVWVSRTVSQAKIIPVNPLPAAIFDDLRLMIMSLQSHAFYRESVCGCVCPGGARISKDRSRIFSNYPSKWNSEFKGKLLATRVIVLLP
jgi:hypothetical protein